MKFFRYLSFAFVLSAALAPAAYADAVVNVTLIDKAGSIDLTTLPKLGMGMKGDMSNARMGININPKSVPRGNVTFNVTNLASNMVHEVLLVRITSEDDLLPYDQGRNKVDMEAQQMLGSVSEIEPSKTASLTLDLAPGKYLLYCNIAGHYMAGMWTVIDVK